METYFDRANDFLQKTDTRMSVTFLKNESNPLWDKNIHPHYLIKLKNKRGSFSFPFWDSISHMKNGIAPTAYDILSCLSFCCYGFGDFVDFCREFGYDYEDRTEEAKIRKIYKLSCREADALVRLFTEEEREELAQID